MLDDLRTFHYDNYTVFKRIFTSLGVSGNPMFWWIFSNSCPMNLLLVGSHQAKRIIAKRFIQRRNNVNREQVKSRSYDQSHCKHKSFILLSSQSFKLFSYTGNKTPPKKSILPPSRFYFLINPLTKFFISN